LLVSLAGRIYDHAPQQNAVPLGEPKRRQRSESRMETPSQIQGIPPIRYATFTRRARALLVDTAILGAALAVVTVVGDFVSNVPGSGRALWILLFGFLFLYEPILVGLRGATVGHAANDLVVVSDATGRRPSFARAFLRYLTKLPLGMLSFVTMATTRRHQAIHDLLTATTVQAIASAELDEGEYQVERVDEGILMPTRLRRGAMILLYLAVVLVSFGIALGVVSAAGCARPSGCTPTTRVIADGLSFLWLGASLGVIISGWRGLLFGARRRPLVASEPVP
jgi:uncharacterized RDD family membrane protein YckC